MLPAAVRQHWLTSLVLATMAALYLVAGLSVTSINSGDGRAQARAGIVPLSMPVLKKALPAREGLEIDTSITPAEAQLINAAVPFSTLPNPAARPYQFAGDTSFDRLRALDCLTAAVYYEAATEPVEGQRAVAQVVLNRTRHPAYPSTVCGVVFEGSERATGCQFTFTCDGAMARRPVEALWLRAREIAEAALAGQVYAAVGYSTHYHTNWVVPYWSSSLEKVANVGTHIFYRWSNGWGRPEIFRSRHAGMEPELAKMRHLSSVPSTEQPLEVTEVASAANAAADAGTALSAQPDGAVQRRYEPLRQQAADAVLAAQVAPSAGAPSTHIWALTGAQAGSAETPLGKKVASAPVAAPCAAPPVKAGTAPTAAATC